MKKKEFARPIIEALQRDDPNCTTKAVSFLMHRLTEAAIEGCHHCGEGERGTPCNWCGLKN